MLPWLSRLSVSIRPESRLRHWCSSQYLRIPPLHWEFHSPLLYSSQAVSDALPQLSCGLSHLTYPATYTPFTPSDSEQRSPPPSYRGCWHGVSRGFLLGYCQALPIAGSCLHSLRQGFTTRRPSSPTRRRCVRLSSIAQDSQLLPPVGVWAVSQSQCGRIPSQAGYPSSPW